MHDHLFYIELVKRRRQVHKKRPLVLPPSVNIESLKKYRARRQKPEKNWINIGFIGTMHWWQGVDILVKALSILKQKIPNIRLIIIGDGPQRKEIEKLSKDLNVPYEITGYVSHKEALEKLSSLNLLVLPRRKMSTTETIIPIKIIEAWALGVPVVVTRTNVFVKNKIRNYEEVVYCEPEPYNVANVIYTLLNNNELRKKLETNGPKIAEQFDYNKIAGRLLEAFGDQ